MEVQLSFYLVGFSLILCAFLFQESAGFGSSSLSIASLLPPFKGKTPDLKLYGGKHQTILLQNVRETSRRDAEMEQFGGGNWAMIPNMQSHSNPTTPSNQDQLFIQHQFNQQQFQQQNQPRFQQQQQSLASHFHLLHLVENLGDITENGSRDQQTDALIAELNTQFDKCQQLLNSIGGTIKAKSTTVEGQKKKLEETENLLTQRRDLMSKYRNSVEELIYPQT